MEIVEKSLQVKNRDQFFLWIQGCFQYLFPHDVMICGLSSNGGENFRYEVFSSLPGIQLPQAQQMLGSAGSLITQAFQHWRLIRRPVILMPGLDQSLDTVVAYKVDADSQQELLLLRNLVMHGVTTSEGLVSSFFCFAHLPRQPEVESLYVLELLLPYLHLLLLRISNPYPVVDAYAGNQYPSIQLTSREHMVLKWLNKAKTNWEIAAILNISPLTVKNHVQNIMRKLDVDNRGQAVLKARTLNLIE